MVIQVTNSYTARHDLIPMMELTRGMAEHYIDPLKARPKIMCKFFEDNSGALEMAHTPKLQPKNQAHTQCIPPLL